MTEEDFPIDWKAWEDKEKIFVEPALSLAIDHWEANLRMARAHRTPDIGAEFCSLCYRYREDSCSGCPVNFATTSWCSSSPYVFVVRIIHRIDKDGTQDVLWEHLKYAVQLELDFLKMLQYDNAKARAIARYTFDCFADEYCTDRHDRYHYVVGCEV